MPWWPRVRRSSKAARASHVDRGRPRSTRRAGGSATHFSRAFKQRVRPSPFDWLRERRIERATLLLEESRLSIVEVALAVGFAARPQFTTAFGTATGMMPGRGRHDRVG